MNKLDGLIERLCPDGVPYLPLSACAEYTNRHIAVSDLDKTSFVGVDNLLPNRGGRADAKHLPNTSQVKRFSANDILIGNIRPYLKKIWLADRSGGCSGDVLAIHIRELCTGRLQPQFLYYLLSSDDFFRYDQLHAKGGTIPRGNKKQILSYYIPIPPIRIQNEIVQILNSYTSSEKELEEELEEELESRQHQYIVYRDSIMSQLSRNSKHVPLSQFAKVVRGHGLTRAEFTNSGVGAIHYGQIYTSFDTCSESVLSYVSPEIAAKLVKVNPGDVIVTNTSENVKDVGKAIAWLGNKRIVTGGHATVLRHNQNSKYIAYWFQTPEFQQQKIRFLTGTSVIDMSTRALANITMPLPALEDQQRAVSMLDKFRSVFTDIETSLQAEIEARRKQYKYYRDQLLTFKESQA